MKKVFAYIVLIFLYFVPTMLTSLGIHTTPTTPYTGVEFKIGFIVVLMLYGSWIFSCIKIVEWLFKDKNVLSI